MKSEEFYRVRQSLEDIARDILDAKGIAYAQEAISDDRLGNFKRASQKFGVSPLTVIGVFLAKHMDSIETWIREAESLDEPPKTVGGELIALRIVDARNYLDLLYAMYCEMGKRTPEPQVIHRA